VENGCKVIISSSNPQRVEQTVKKLQQSYPSQSKNVSGHACNLGDEKSIEKNIVDLLEKTGKVDHIIYTAADALAQMPLDTIDIEKIHKAGLLRFFGPLLVGKHAPKYLTPGPKSSITLTTGGVSQKPIPDWTVIGAYATGLHGVTRGLALDLKPIRVNLVSPGAVDTELWTNSGFSEEQRKGMMDGIASKLPTGKVPGPEEIAEAYVYLLRDHNITGTMVSTNGGFLLA
jgi:NAD(P)-dependent dehydrogenase (short-subunit alcohol dehydrogenase family)